MGFSSAIVSFVLAITVISAAVIKTKETITRRPYTTKRFTMKYVKIWRKLTATTRRPLSKPHTRQKIVKPVPRSVQELHPQQETTPQTNKWHNDPWFRREKFTTAKVMTPRTDSIYVDSATLVPLPDQPIRKVRMLLSVIVQNTGLTNGILKTAVNCLANGTDTSSNVWGAYNADRFTPELVQVEFYSLLDESAVQSFSATVDQYIQKGHLTQCLQAADIGFSSESTAFAARVVTAPGATVVSEAAGAPAWAIGIAIGIAAIVGIVVLVVTAFRGDGDDDDDDKSMDGDDVEDVESAYPVQFIDVDDPDEFYDEEAYDRALKAISGPGNLAMVSAAPR